MKGQKALIDTPFRYGGFSHDYTKNAEFFTYDEPKCYACDETMRGEKPYAALFHVYRGKLKGQCTIRLLCRGCAYAYDKGVVERDGERYQRIPDYRGEL